MFRRSWFCKIRVKRRYIVALLAFFGFCNIYMLRFTSWQHSVYFHKNRCTCICVMSAKETLLAGWECVCPSLSIQKQDLLNPCLQFFVIVYAFFQGKLECGGGGDDNKPDSPPTQWNHYRGKQSQTNANTNTKSTMTNTSTNKTRITLLKERLPRHANTKLNTNNVFFLVLIFVKIVNKSFSKM